MYKKKLTQQDKILNLLVERGDKGAFVYELTSTGPQGLGIQQYNARILELRRKGHNIENKTPGHFVLKDHIPEPTYKWVVRDGIAKQERLQNLEAQKRPIAEQLHIKV